MNDGFFQDLRYAARSMARRPMVTAVTALSLALGIGVNSALFSVFDHLLLRDLPVASPDQLVLITSPGPRPGGTSTGAAGRNEAVFSYPLFRDLERLTNVGLSSIDAHRDFLVNLAYRGQTQHAEGLLVSGGYFSALGIVPTAGRLLTHDDDRVPDGQPVVVLSHAYWTSRFGARPDVVGDTLYINGQPMTIVGVAPDGFTGTTAMESPEVFAPLAMSARLSANPERENRRNHWVYVFGRLSPGVSREQAESRLNVPFTALIRDVEYPLVGGGLGSDRQRAEFQARRLFVRDGSRLRNADSDRLKTLAIVLFGVTGFVLLIACANVANLLLARATDRSTEMALRLSMGASTARVIRLLLTEACLLGVLGGAAALLVSKGTLAWLITLVPVEDRATIPFVVDGRVLVFTLALGLVTGLGFGLIPAFYGARRTVDAIHAGAPRASGTPSAMRMRTTLATTQIALATALLATAGLFVVSLFNLSRVELGIKTDGLMSFRLSPFLNGYVNDRFRALIDRVEDGVRALPGVTSVGESTIVLLGNDGWTQNVSVEGFNTAPDDDVQTNSAYISPDYFATVGVPLLAGRDFTRADAGTSTKVAIVNEAFARKFHLDAGVIGTHLALGRGPKKALDIEIVGLVRDARHTAVRENNPPQMFLPYRQGVIGSITFYVRSTLDAAQIVPAITTVVARADRNLPLENVRTMNEQVWNSVTADRVLATLSSSFAGLATILAGIGLYAMLAHIVARRVREMGIRIALGAQRGDVARLIFAHVGRITLIGGTVGAALAVALGRVGRSVLFGLDGSAPAIVGSAVVLVVAVAFAAGFAPARRASLVNPVDALRAE